MSTVKQPEEPTNNYCKNQEYSSEVDYSVAEDSSTFDAVCEDQLYSTEDTTTNGTGGASGAPNKAGGSEGAGGTPNEAGSSEKVPDSENGSELTGEFAKHAAVEIVDKIIVDTLRVTEGIITLFVLVLEIASGCGDTNCEELKVIKYSAGCDGDHNDGGSCWSGPQRDTKEEALADIRAHLAMYPDHTAELYI